MDFRLLGPVELWVDGRRVDTGQPRQRSVLAALLVDAGRIVTPETLVDRVWGDEPPDGARRALHAYVTRVRQLLGQANATLARRSGGYLLEVEPDRVDLHRFRRLVGQARQPGWQSAERVSLLREALALWRGEPLAGLRGPWVARMRDGWQRQRLDTVVAWGRAEVDVGNPAVAIGPLTDLVDEHPLMEPLTAALMAALHAAGRRAEALDRYAATRRRLADELGADPSPPLQRLHQEILRGVPSTGTPPGPPPDPQSAPAPARAARVVPAQLPLNVAGFTGRDAEMERLDGVLTATGEYPTSVLVAVLSGTAGVGKTALAVHWAHRVAHRFRDGQLYVNLRGFDPRGPAMPPAEAVRGFLDAFEVPPQRIPSGLAAQINLYRSLVAGRRMLVVLDNAADADQVRALLPGAPGCLALVTSRHRLSSLAVTEGARPVPVDLLDVADARDLLARKLGERAVAAAPKATDEVIAACARLPLALAVAAARAAGPPAIPLAALSAELRAGRDRLDAFAGEDPSTDVRTVLSWSYRGLDPAAARLFRLLAAHPTAEVGPPAAASLADTTQAAARRSLAELARAHLLIELPGGRYTCHDLLRAYAGELLSTVDSSDERDAAADRMLDHYLHTAHAAALLLHPHRDRLTLGVPRDGVSPEPLADHDAALAWFASEHAALLGAIELAVATGRHRYAWQLAWTPIDYFDRRGHWHNQVTAQRTAVAAAARLGDRAAQAYSLRGLARACSRFGEYDEALAHYERALELFGAVGDAVGQARTHLSLSVVFERERRFSEALHHTRQALKLYRQAGQVAGEAEALNGVAWCHAQLGEYQPARAHCERALALLQDLGDVHSEANSWDTLGYVHDKLGDHARAIECFLRAVELFRRTGGRYFEADTLARLGEAHRAAGDPAGAADALRRALRILDELGHPDADRVRAQLAA